MNAVKQVEMKTTEYKNFGLFLRNMLVHGQAAGFDHVRYQVVVDVARSLSGYRTCAMAGIMIAIKSDDDGGIVITMIDRFGRKREVSKVTPRLPEGYVFTDCTIEVSSGYHPFDQFVTDLVATFNWLNGEYVEQVQTQAKLQWLQEKLGCTLGMQEWIVGMNGLYDIASMSLSDSVVACDYSVNTKAFQKFDPCYRELVKAIDAERVAITGTAIGIFGFDSEHREAFQPPMVWFDNDKPQNVDAFYLRMVTSMGAKAMRLAVVANSTRF